MLAVRDLPPAARVAALEASLREFGVADASLEVSGSEFVLEVGDSGFALDSCSMADLEALVLAVLNFQAAEHALAVPAPHSARLAAASRREAAREDASAALARLSVAGVFLGAVILAAPRRAGALAGLAV